MQVDGGQALRFFGRVAFDDTYNGLALDDAVDKGRLAPGHKVLFCASGGESSSGGVRNQIWNARNASANSPAAASVAQTATALS